MKYIVLKKPNELVYETKSAPVVTEGHAILRVRRVGICGTDLHAYNGNQAYFSYPRVLGHELAAEVLEVGHGEHKLVQGDKVAVVPYINCEVCVACRTGKTNCCENLKVFGVHTDGGMQELISFPTRLLIPANDLSLDEIAILEPLAIGAHALRRAGLKNGESVVVIGCGPIGVGIIQLARYMGAKVIAVDVNAHRSNAAKEKFGADSAVNPLDSPVEKIRAVLQGQLADTVIDATGNKGAIESATRYMRHGGNLILVGISKGELSFQHPEIHAKEITLMCSRNATLEDFEFVMNTLRAGQFNSTGYITDKVEAKSILNGFPSWTSPESKDIKVITTWD